jgi:hypothetical protein
VATIDYCPTPCNTCRTVTCTSCEILAKIPDRDFWKALQHLGWSVFDIGGKPFYLCTICQTHAQLSRLAQCLAEKGQRALFLDAQEELRDLDTIIAQRRAVFSRSLRGTLTGKRNQRQKTPQQDWLPTPAEGNPRWLH